MTPRACDPIIHGTTAGYAARGRWFAWMWVGLLARGVPPTAALSLGHPGDDPLVSSAVVELTWTDGGVRKHARVVEPCRLRLVGWHGWQAYRAGGRLLRALG